MFSQFPNDALWNTFMQSDYEDITRLCRSNKDLQRRLCQSNEYWLRRFTAEHDNVTEDERTTLLDSAEPFEDYVYLSYHRWFSDQGRDLDEIYNDDIIKSLFKGIMKSDNRALLLLRYFLREHPDEYDRLFENYSYRATRREFEVAIDLFLKDPRDLFIAFESVLFGGDLNSADYIYNVIKNYKGDNALSPRELEDYLFDQLRYALEHSEVDAANWLYHRLLKNRLRREEIKKRLPPKLRGAFNDIVDLNE